jgi:hypothetical protein
MFHVAIENAKTAFALAIPPTLISGVITGENRTPIFVLVASFLTAWAATGCGVKR